MTNKKKEKEYVCPHDIDLTAEEEDAINWLRNMLEQGARQCSSTSRMAHVAHVAVGKVFSKMHKLHTEVHAYESALLEADMIVSGMTGVPRSPGREKDEDLN